MKDLSQSYVAQEHGLYVREKEAHERTRTRMAKLEEVLARLVDEYIANRDTSSQFVVCITPKGTPDYWQAALDVLDAHLNTRKEETDWPSFARDWLAVQDGSLSLHEFKKRHGLPDVEART